MSFNYIYRKLEEEVIPKIKEENREFLYEYAMFILVNVEEFVKENGGLLLDLGEFVEFWKTEYPELAQKLEMIDDDDIGVIEDFFRFMKEEIIESERNKSFAEKNTENDIEMDFKSFLEEVKSNLSVSIDGKTEESLRKLFEFASDYLKENHYHDEKIFGEFKKAYPDDYKRIKKLDENENVDVFLDIGCIIELMAMG